MNVTRIQVPVSLPEPHFEDQATVVSARQVVPLDQARTQDRRRKVLRILPILFAATLCGALGALAVNYFTQRSSAPTVSQPSTTSAKPDQQQTAPAPSPDNAVITSADSQDKIADVSQPLGSSLANDSSAAESPEAPASAKPKTSVTSVRKPSTPGDPKQLVRQRRVHPPSDGAQAGQNDQSRSRGAARIQDIFSGPNP